MKLTPEQVFAAKSAKSPEELIAIADKIGVKMDEPNAALYYNRLHTNPELSDDELAAISGGEKDCYGQDYVWNKPCLHGRPDTIWRSDCEDVYGCKNWRYRRYMLNGVEMLDATCWHWTLDRPDKDSGYTE